MTVYNWIMAISSVLVIGGLLYLFVTGKAANRAFSKREKVLYHIILLLLFVEILLRHIGLRNKNILDVF